MKFVNLDESEIIEQPLEKVIARPDYSPVEFVYDDLCSLDSVSVDGIHPSGDDPDLILSPSINKINNCFKSKYFKISNLFSEIQTYEQKQEALKNLGLLDAINNSSYIHDLGRFDKQVDAEEAAVNVANNSNVVIILYYIGSQNGIIFQQVGDTITKQILLWDNTIFQRHVNFSDSSKTQVSSTSYWWKLGATHISYDPDTRKFHLQDMNYKNLNPTVDSKVPLASSTKDGFMSKEQAQKLGTTLVKNDITNNLTTSSSTKVLSAQMGKTLKTEIDKLQQLAVKDLGTDLQPHIATGNIITYVKDNNIKETVLFKYIDIDGSSTLGVCISRINDIGWIIYLVARKGIERLVFNSNGVREEWNEYGGVLRHNLDSVANEQLECLSVKGVKSLLSTKQDALSPGDGITMMNNTVSTLIGNGLTYNGREIVIDHDLTLKTNNGKLGVNAGDGLYVNPDNELGINVGKGLTINHTDSTVEVAEEVLNDITIKSGTGTNSSLQINAPGSKASGTNSLAVGMDAIASGDYSIAMGRGCSATGRGSIALGGIIISMKLTGDKGAIRYQSSINSIIAEYLPGFSLVKTSDLTTSVATITASEVIDNVVYITVDKTLSSSSALSNTTFGLIGNRASGAGSIALGAGLLSSNQHSIAEGWMTVATGSYSHAEGSFNIAKGNSSHAEGGYSIAEGIRSHAEGYYTVAKAASSHAEGDRSLASGDASHAEGYGTVASGDYSHTEGSSVYNIYLTGNNSTYQINYGSNIQNTFHFIRRCQGASIIEYTNFTKIAVINSIDLSKDGYTVTVVTDVDLGELSNYKCGVAVNIASGQSSHTENAAQSSGKESHAGGWSLSTNECSFSHGYDCVADGKVSTSFGTNTYSQNNSEFALGRSNHSHTGETLAEQTLFSVGYGDFEQIDMSKRIEQQLPLPAPEDGTNALEIMQNGDIWLGGYEEGVKLFEGETKELNTYTKEELGIELLTNGNLKLTLKGQTKEFMPATPSGDPMHYAYETAGAVYNATTDFIVKNAPWANMVDTIEDKAKWGFDVVDASKVQQMTIKGVEYNYATENRTSPEGGTYLRYFLVEQGSNGFWVEDETKVLHLPKCWYLNGLGDITNTEMRRMFEEKEVKYRWDKSRGGQNIRSRTIIPVNNMANIDMIPSLNTPYSIQCESICVTFIEKFIVKEPAQALSVFSKGATNKTRYIQTCKNASGTPFANARVVSFIKLDKSCTMSDVRLLSKPSILYTIENAAPTTAISITLHPDAYARLVEDPDVVSDLETKNAELQSTGGSISLVSA